MTIRDLIQELVRSGELDTRVVIETPNGEYNVTRVDSQYCGDNAVYLQIDS